MLQAFKYICIVRCQQRHYYIDYEKNVISWKFSSWLGTGTTKVATLNRLMRFQPPPIV